MNNEENIEQTLYMFFLKSELSAEEFFLLIKKINERIYYMNINQ